MLRRKISSNITDLNKLNKTYKWIPNEFTIRPDYQTLEYKKNFSKQILEKWSSLNEYIYHEVFQANPNNTWVFQPSIFRYNIPYTANHYVLWNIEHNLYDNIDDEIINNKIIDELNKLFGTSNDNIYDFAWYKNPKPTVPEYYHVQVFWIVL